MRNCPTREKPTVQFLQGWESAVADKIDWPMAFTYAGEMVFTRGPHRVVTVILTDPTDPASHDRHGQVGRCSRPEIESHPSRAVRLAKEVCLDRHSHCRNEMLSGAGPLLVQPGVSIIIKASADRVRDSLMAVKERWLTVLTGRAARARRGVWPVRRVRRCSLRVNGLGSRRISARALVVSGSVRLPRGT
jgi:hypothetical protein